MKQKQYSPLSVADMAVSLYAVNQGFMDDVPVKKIGAFEHALQTYMRNNQAALLDEINKTGDYTDEMAAKFKAALTDFKANHQNW